ncbi:MAG TPA: GNAT family protein [Actinomycetes bacterium]
MPSPNDRAAAGFVPVVDDRPADAAWGALVWPPPTGPLGGCFVELRPVDLDSDVDALFAAVDHDAVWQHVAGRPTSAAEYVVTLRGQLDVGRLPWVVRLARPMAGLPAGTVVGTSSYLEASVPDARLEIGSTAYTPAVWGSVVNPEVKLLLLSLAFDTLGAGRVQLKTDVRNVRSQRAVARLGAHYEGTLRRYQRRTDGTVRDTVLFSVVAEEWPRVRAGLVERVAAAAN